MCVYIHIYVPGVRIVLPRQACMSSIAESLRSLVFGVPPQNYSALKHRGDWAE